MEAAAKDRLCLSEEVGVAGLLSMEVAGGWGSLVGNGLGQEAGARSDFEKTEERERIPVQGAEGRVCPVGVAGVQSL